MGRQVPDVWCGRTATGSEAAKAISTSAIWLSTAVILTFGLFRMNGDFLFFFLGMAIIAGAAAGATVAVWHRPPAAPPTPEREPPRNADPGAAPARGGM